MNHKGTKATKDYCSWDAGDCAAHSSAQFKWAEELITKLGMKQQGRDGLAGCIRTTWLPYTERGPESMRDEFIDQLVDQYIDRHPLDEDGYCHVPMVRLEVQGTRVK